MKRLLTFLMLWTASTAWGQAPLRWSGTGDSLTAKNDTARFILDLPSPAPVGYITAWFDIDTSACNGVRPKFAFKIARGFNPALLRTTVVRDTIIRDPDGTALKTILDSVKSAFGAVADTSVNPPVCSRLYLYLIEADTLGMQNTAGKNYARFGFFIQ